MIKFGTDGWRAILEKDFKTLKKYSVIVSADSFVPLSTHHLTVSVKTAEIWLIRKSLGRFLFFC